MLIDISSINKVNKFTLTPSLIPDSILLLEGGALSIVFGILSNPIHLSSNTDTVSDSSLNSSSISFYDFSLEEYRKTFVYAALHFT